MTEHLQARITSDIVVVVNGGVLLIERKYPPFSNCSALPGGHVEEGQTFLDAAVAELEEETGVKVPADAFRKVGIYDDPDRDPRGRVVSVAWLVELDERPDARADSDAAAVYWYDIAEILHGEERRHDAGMSSSLAFDHARILRDAYAMLTN